MAVERLDLQDLVDNPTETTAIAVKLWIDLGERVNQAKIARHLAALANYGGGYLIFGFDDNLLPIPATSYPPEHYNRDALSAIVKSFLAPPFQCEVYHVTSSAGITHPVVWVPSHGASPICVRASGPHDAKGKPQGIVMGTYYIRAPGPESVPIVTPDQWAPVIRRCVLHERTTLVTMIESLLRAPAAPTPHTEDELKRWHNQAHERFLGELAKVEAPPWVLANHYQFSYAIRLGEPEELDAVRLLEIVRQVNAEVHDLIAPGWSMFYPFTRPEIAPYIATDPTLGEEEEFLETSLLADREVDFSKPDFWRISVTGKATLLRAYFEDRPRPDDHRHLTPERWLSPFSLVRGLAELVRHARALAERFNTPQAVAFRCEWYGLKGREIYDRIEPWWPRGMIARSDARVVTGEWAVAELTGSWPEIVSELASPVTRLFGPSFTLSSEWVRAQIPRFRVMGHFGL